ncbi:MAG TPA: Wzz/FepE/Etk N-terminal domain-containing protein, partial [Cryomorphaceae bacterium]|nr:Wzz/FepE/Etk N-terminal domain-containing protein [Cryomorphaceae bacterium]
MYGEDISKINTSFESYKERLTNFSNEFELGLFLHILRKNLYLVVIFVCLAIAGSYIFLRYTAPVYEARTVIQLSNSDNAKRVLNVNQFYDNNSLLAEIELMRSKLLVERVINKLPLEISYFEKGEVLTDQRYPASSFVMEMLAVTDSSIMDTPIFVRFKENNTYHLELRGEQLGETHRVGQLAQNKYFTYKLLVIDANHFNRVEEGEIEFYFKLNRPQTLANQYSRQLGIKILNNTAKTVEVSLKDNNPGIARDFVVNHAEEYIKFELENREQSATSIIRFIDSQLDTVYRNLRDSELLLNIYKKENKISNLDNLSSLYFDYFREFENEMVELELEESMLAQVVETIETDSDVDVYNIIPILTGTKYETIIASMLESLRDLLVSREEVQFDLKEGSAKLEQLDYSINIQKKLIVESIQSALDKIQRRQEFLGEKLEEYESDFGELPKKELEFARLKRIFDINEKYYTMLLEKKTEYRISQAGYVPENRVLERLISSNEPISPKKNLITTSAILAAVLLSLLIIVIKYLLHSNITSLSEITKLSNASINILGMIPKYKKDIPTSQLLIDKSPKSMISEAFRSLRTNLQFMGEGVSQDQPRVISITSTTSGEGKTFVAINLAGIIAYSGQRVIVLDLDMRKPKIHIGFDVDNLKGMSTILIGKSSLEECVRNSKVENLDFITAGPIPPNPAELIIGK